MSHNLSRSYVHRSLSMTLTTLLTKAATATVSYSL